jgi:hypothetical protein
LLAVAVYLLVDGLEGRLATVCRVALLPFVLFYGAWESYTGIGTGELVRHAHDVPAEDQALAGEMIQSYFESPVAGNISILSGLGGTSWLVSVVAAALAIRKTGAPRSIWILFGLAAVAFFVGHPPPTGPIGLVLFAVAAAWFGWRGAPLADAGGDVLPEPAAVAD